MNAPKIPVWLLPAILLTALLSLYSISLRYKVEQRNKAVSIAAEYETIETLAAGQQLSMSQALANLKLQGLGSVVISEEYLADLINEGRAELTPKGVVVLEPNDYKRVTDALMMRFGGGWSIPPIPNQEPIGVPVTGATLRGMPIGLDPRQTATIREAGLKIVARLANPPGVNTNYVIGSLTKAHDEGATVFLPMGDQVLGRRDAIKTTAETIERLGMLYATPEFTKLGGDANMLGLIPESVVRLHPAQTAELDKLPFSEAVDRYSRAARERGMRILLVRPLTNASEAPLSSFAEFIKAINLDVQKQGGAMGDAKPSQDSNVPRWLFLLIGLSLIPTGYFVGSAFVQKRTWRLAGLALLVLMGLGAWTKAGQSYDALLAALIFPTAAFLILDARERPKILLDFLLVSAISLVGGLAVAGLLNGLPFFIRADEFTGVKAAVFLPILLVAVYYLARIGNLAEALKSPMTWGSAIVGILILGGLMFMSSRTGNDNPAGVSGMELQFRNLLDNILFVRPRTKEFMIGHPLLIVGIGLLALYRKRPTNALGLWTALALAGGAIGQTSIVNTMCHIHTPVALSLARIGMGVIAGCIIGLAVWAIARRALPKGD